MPASRRWVTRLSSKGYRSFPTCLVDSAADMYARTAASWRSRACSCLVGSSTKVLTTSVDAGYSLCRPLWNLVGLLHRFVHHLGTSYVPTNYSRSVDRWRSRQFDLGLSPCRIFPRMRCCIPWGDSQLPPDVRVRVFFASVRTYLNKSQRSVLLESLPCSKTFQACPELHHWMAGEYSKSTLNYAKYHSTYWQSGCCTCSRRQKR
jgi:hypothetical protein